jgi:hypothetical protein
MLFFSQACSIPCDCILLARENSTTDIVDIIGKELHNHTALSLFVCIYLFEADSK